MTNGQLIKRLELVEQQLEEVIRRMGPAAPLSEKKNWRDFIGMFQNDKYFERAMKAGAAYRQGLRPASRPKRAKRK